jgi:hypothetical protein
VRGNGITRWATRNITKPEEGKKDPDVEEALNQLFSTVTGRGVRVSGPMWKRNFLTKWSTRTEERHIVGCLDASLGLPLG